MTHRGSELSWCAPLFPQRLAWAISDVRCRPQIPAPFRRTAFEKDSSGAL
jgi:hypothetical protein